MNSSPIRRRSPFLRSSSLILGLSGLSLFLAYLFSASLAAGLGTSLEMDVFLVAITLPTAIATLAQFVFPLVLVPVLIERSEKSEHLNELRWAGISIAIAIGIGVVVVVQVAADPIIRLAAPGFSLPAKNLAAVALRIMILGSLFDMLRGVLTAQHYSRSKFLLPQLAPSAKNLIMLAAVFVLLIPLGVVGLAWAWTLGSIVMLLLLIPGRTRFGPLPSSSAIRRSVRVIGRPLLPAALAGVMIYAVPFVDRAVASTLTSGAISYLGYGSKVLEIMLRTIPMGVTMAIFPLVSLQASRKDWNELSALIIDGIRWILIAGLPLSMLVFMFREPLISALFERGSFGQADTLNVAHVLLWYSVAFLPASLLLLHNQLFMALQRHRSLVVIWGINLAGTAVLDLVLSQIFGYSGIAVAYLVISLVILGVFTVQATKLEIQVQYRPQLSWLGRVLASTLAVGALLFAISQVSQSQPGLVRLAVYASLGAMAYSGMLRLLGVFEISILARTFFLRGIDPGSEAG